MQAAIEMRLEAAVEKLLERHAQAINAPAEKQGREQIMIRIDDFELISFDERVVLKCVKQLTDEKAENAEACLEALLDRASTRSLLDAGFTAQQLLASGVQIRELVDNGVPIQELLDSGACSHREIAQALCKAVPASSGKGAVV
eukprot:2029943-Amphidinium_carterae.1